MAVVIVVVVHPQPMLRVASLPLLGRQRDLCRCHMHRLWTVEVVAVQVLVHVSRWQRLLHRLLRP